MNLHDACVFVDILFILFSMMCIFSLFPFFFYHFSHMQDGVTTFVGKTCNKTFHYQVFGAPYKDFKDAPINFLLSSSNPFVGTSGIKFPIYHGFVALDIFSGFNFFILFQQSCCKCLCERLLVWILFRDEKTCAKPHYIAHTHSLSLKLEMKNKKLMNLDGKTLIQKLHQKIKLYCDLTQIFKCFLTEYWFAMVFAFVTIFCSIKLRLKHSFSMILRVLLFWDECEVCTSVQIINLHQFDTFGVQKC